ncbi:MAG: alcohol dehydrogenase catalytic domain-containing protein [Chloroflexi bacterium]|nr:alcohol dehydrogenase catalytic domain-containing protein [Chloroflexota bacterium]
MQVAVYEGARAIRLEERPRLTAAPGQVIVKVKYCGICGTDVHAYQSDGFLPPGLVLGHETVGTIAEIGEGVEGWEFGERVAVGPPGPCGDCYYCRQGRSAICVHAFERTNGLAPGCDGGFAEYVRVRYPRNMLFRLPDQVSFEDAVLLDTIAVALRGVRQSRFRIGDNVVVTGAGAIGVSVLQFLRLGGARHITVLEPSEKKRALALAHRADMALNPLEQGTALKEKIISAYGGIGADVAFECAGVPASFQTALDLVKGGGQVMVLGVSEKQTPIVPAELIVRETEIKASLAYAEEDVRICLDYLANRKFNPAGMVSDIIRLDKIVERGFERLVTTKDLVKIVVAP